MRFIAMRRLVDGASANEFQQTRFQIEVRLPKFAIIDVLDPFPNFGLAAALVPSRTQMAVVQPEHLRSEPRGHMHSIGDVSDWNAVFQLARRKSCPHGAGD